MSDAPTAQAAKADEFRFWPSDPPERDMILAICIAHQRKAGFGNLLDLRESKCDGCGSSGFNTGFGFWAFGCGREMLTTEDGNHEPCPLEAAPHTVQS